LLEIRPTIAILGGTGKQGPGLALRWASRGYMVLIGSRELEKAQRIAAELNEQLGIETIKGFQNADAARRADISVLTVVHSAHRSALQDLKPSLQGKILVDATARVEFRDPKPPQSPSAGEVAQSILGPGVRVVAAYQNVPASALRKDLDESIHTDVLICSDDLDAAEEVIRLTEAAGMGAYYAGGLENAIVVESLTSLIIAMNKYYRGHGTIRISGIDKNKA